MKNKLPIQKYRDRGPSYALCDHSAVDCRYSTVLSSIHLHFSERIACVSTIMTGIPLHAMWGHWPIATGWTGHDMDVTFWGFGDIQLEVTSNHMVGRLPDHLPQPVWLEVMMVASLSTMNITEILCHVIWKTKILCAEKSAHYFRMFKATKMEVVTSLNDSSTFTRKISIFYTILPKKEIFFVIVAFGLVW